MIFAGVAYVRFWIIAHCQYQNKPLLKTPHLMQRSSIYLLRKPSSNPLCPKFCCHGNKGRSGKNSRGIIRWPIPKNPLQTQKFCRYLLHKPSLSQILSQNSLPWQQGSPGEKFKWQHQIARPENIEVGANSAQLSFMGPSYSQYCPKIRCHGNESWQGKDLYDNIG